MLAPRQLNLCPTLLGVALHNHLSLVARLCTGMARAVPLTPLTFIHRVQLTSSECLHYPCLPPGPSSSLDISSCPLTPFPAPTLTPQLLFWPVCWTHQGLGVGQWSLLVKSEHYWVPDMCDSTHKRVYTHVCVHTCTCTPSCLLCCVRCGDYFLWQISSVKSLKMFRGVQPAFCLLQPWDLERI